jgi:hypothetical protein
MHPQRVLYIGPVILFIAALNLPWLVWRVARSAV